MRINYLGKILTTNPDVFAFIAEQCTMRRFLARYEIPKIPKQLYLPFIKSPTANTSSYEEVVKEFLLYKTFCEANNCLHLERPKLKYFEKDSTFGRARSLSDSGLPQDMISEYQLDDQDISLVVKNVLGKYYHITVPGYFTGEELLQHVCSNFEYDVDDEYFGLSCTDYLTEQQIWLKIDERISTVLGFTKNVFNREKEILLLLRYYPYCTKSLKDDTVQIIYWTIYNEIVTKRMRFTRIRLAELASFAAHVELGPRPASTDTSYLNDFSFLDAFEMHDVATMEDAKHFVSERHAKLRHTSEKRAKQTFIDVAKKHFRYGEYTFKLKQQKGSTGTKLMAVNHRGIRVYDNELLGLSWKWHSILKLLINKKQLSLYIRNQEEENIIQKIKFASVKECLEAYSEICTHHKLFRCQRYMQAGEPKDEDDKNDACPIEGRKLAMKNQAVIASLRRQLNQKEVSQYELPGTLRVLPCDADLDFLVDARGTRCWTGAEAAWLSGRLNRGVRTAPEAAEDAARGAFWFGVRVLRAEAMADGYARVGWSAAGTNRLVGRDRRGYGYGADTFGYDDEHCCKHSAGLGYFYGAAAIRTGDRVYSLVDFGKRTVSWLHNRIECGVGFSLEPSVCTDGLFPTVSLHNAEVELFFSEEDVDSTERQPCLEGFDSLVEASPAYLMPNPTQRVCLSEVDRTAGMQVLHDAEVGHVQDGAGWQCARASYATRLQGVFYYEVTVVSAGLIRVGWSSGSASLDLGSDEHGFGFGSDDDGYGLCDTQGKLVHRRVILPYGVVPVAGTTVGCCVSATERIAHFIVDGMTYAKHSFANSIAPPYYPAIAVNNGTVHANFGYRKFMYLPQEARPMSSVLERKWKS